MSIRDYNKAICKNIIVTDTTTGVILLNQPVYDTIFSLETIHLMLDDVISSAVLFDEHGVNIRIGYKNT